MVGTTGDNICWTGNGSVTYRTDVTSLISGNGNYVVTLNGFANPEYEVDGVTLIVIYNDPTATYSGSMALYDGDLSNDDGYPETFTADSFTVCANSSNATAFTLMGDVQANVNGGVNTEIYNGNTVTFSNNFWNYCNVPVTPTASQTTLIYNTYTNNNSDCYFIGVTGLYWQNTTCVKCAASSTTMTLTTTSTPDSCGNNGTASVNVSGAKGPLTYTWSPGGQTNDTATALAPGIYTVYVNDGNSCAADTVRVANIGMVLSMTSTHAVCNTPGSVSAIVTGGASPYTYRWIHGNTTSSVTGATAGTYSVVVMDKNGCLLIDSTTVSSITGFTTGVSSTPYYSCPTAYGSATVTITNGTPPYTYSWSPGGQTNATATGLTAGYYYVTSSDSNGCMGYDSVLVDSVNRNLGLYIIPTPYYCSAVRGTATVYVTDSAAKPFTYSWSNGQTTSTATGLTPGGYAVTVTGSGGCSQTDSVYIPVASVIFYINAYPTNITTGDSAYLYATDSIPGTTYLWLPSASVTNPNSENSYASPTVTTTYSCIATNACGSDTETVTVTVSCFTLNDTVTAAYYCTGNDSGTAIVIPSGGSSPYTYLWTPGNQTNALATGLTAGNYTVSVTDSAGCTVTASANVPYDSLGFGVFGATTISRGDSAVIEAWCSVANSTFAWTPASSCNTPNLYYSWVHPTVTTTYTVTITTPCDTIVDTVQIIITGTCFTLSETATSTNCSADSGTATAIPSGGSPPFTYLWSPGGQTNATATGLSVGTYSVVVKDSAGCNDSASVTVYSSSSASYSISASRDTILAGDTVTLSAFCSAKVISYNWYPGWDTTSTLTVTPSTTTTYTVYMYTACGFDSLFITVVVVPYLCTNNYDEGICIVTVDTATDRDEIIWGRVNSPPNGSYNVYKNNIFSVFVLLENQPLTAYSDYIDTSSRPQVSSCAYELATVDSCGVSALSAPHASIFLRDSSDTNVNILNWTQYIGFTPSEYRIFRGTSLGNLVQIDSVSSTTYTLYDSFPPPFSVYLVEAVNPSGPCIPTPHIKSRSMASEESVSMSNRITVTNNNTSGIQNIANSVSNLNIYPNPGNGMVTVEWSVPIAIGIIGQLSVRISVVDELGQVVYDNIVLESVGRNTEELNLENLASGIYSLRLQTLDETTVRKLVIMQNR
jgi:hypothetical protein